MVVGGMAALVAFIYVETVLLFTTPAVMLEKQGIRAAMSRSRSLVRGSWWRVFGIFVLASIIAEVIAGIFVVPFALAGAAWGCMPMSAVSAALAIGDSGAEGQVVGLVFSALALATFARMAAVAGGWAVEANAVGRWLALALLAAFGVSLTAEPVLVGVAL